MHMTPGGFAASPEARDESAFPAGDLRMTPDAPVIDIQHLCFSYNGRPVLEDVSLTTASGDFLAVLGPNGGGKTTLVKIILGLLRPNAGSVRVFGAAPSMAAGLVGYVPQRAEERAYGREMPVSVRDVVLMGLLRGWRLGFWHTREERIRAEAALEKVEMLRHASARFAELSGGQQKRVLIARALVSDPKLVILDEPTANIDPQGKYCFYESLGSLGKDVSIVAVSHDLTILAAKVNAVACVNKRLVYSASPRLTPDMLTLLYGEHRHSCPMDAFMQTIPAGLDDFRKVS